MREIKFRAWFKGNPYRDDQPPCMVYDVHKKHADQCPFMYRTFGGMIEDTRSYEVMQFTGLQDRNGKEIYEGDIIRRKRLMTDWQEEQGDNIPYNGYYRHAVGVNFVIENLAVCFHNGTFTVDKDQEIISPLAWDMNGDNFEDQALYDMEKYNLYETYGYKDAEELLNDLSGIVVIGNIYENPELLEATP